jgi:hypothetical protein
MDITDGGQRELNSQRNDVAAMGSDLVLCVIVLLM